MGIQPDSQGAPCYVPGGTYSVCDRCSKKRRREDVAREWTNLIVCKDTCWDPRPPQLDPPNVWPEGIPLPDIRPRPANLFIDVEAPVTPGDL